MKEIKRNIFVNDCEDSLRSLAIRFALKLTGTTLDKWYSAAEFTNSTTGIIFRKERRDHLVHVEVAKLRDGKVVPQPLIIRDDTLLLTIPLHDVLTALGASAEAFQNQIRTTTIREQIDWQVRALEVHATSVLEGDFSSFNLAANSLKRRLNARRRPLSESDKEALLTQFPQLRKHI